MNGSNLQPDVAMKTEKPVYKRWEDLLPAQGDGFNDPAAQLSADQRAYSSCSTRNRLFYDGVAEGSGWPLDAVARAGRLPAAARGFLTSGARQTAAYSQYQVH